MKSTIISHAFPAILAVLVIFTTFPFIESVLRIYSRNIAAVQWHSVEVITKQVRPGDNLELLYSATIQKQCPSDLRGFIVAADGSVPIHFSTVAGGYARPSDAPVESRVKIKLPEHSDPGLAPLESGEYTYRANATRYCPDGIEFDNAIPDATFSMAVTK